MGCLMYIKKKKAASSKIKYGKLKHLKPLFKKDGQSILIKGAIMDKWMTQIMGQKNNVTYS